MKCLARSFQGGRRRGTILTFFLTGIPRIILVTSAQRISTKLGRSTRITVRVNRFSAKFCNFSLGVALPQTSFGAPFRQLRSIFGVRNSKWYGAEKRSSKRAHPCMSSVEQHQLHRPKTCPLRCSPVTRRGPPFCQSSRQLGEPISHQYYFTVLHI